MLRYYKEISLILLSDLAVILFFVLVLSKTKVFKNIMMKREASLSEKILLIAIFGIIGIFGTYNGFPVDGAIANNRAIGVIVGGLMAGPAVGVGAGLIAATHRLYIGGFTMYASSLSTVLEGVVAGFYYIKIRDTKERWFHALLLGLILESLHMLLLVGLSRPLKEVIELVEVIGPPMVIINSLGIGFFMAMLDNAAREQEKIGATAAQLALKIANKTLPYLRKGLNEDSALKATNIIYQMVENLGAVAITSQERILAFVGTGSDHHTGKIITKSTRHAIKTGEYNLSQSKADIGCSESGCPLASQVVVPLKENNEVVGALILFKLNEQSITPFEVELAVGLGQLFSTQIEISKSQIRSKLLAQAEIQALQAQINPHFLFNALNTIVYYCRKEPETARDLLIHLGEFYRNNLVKLDQMVDLSTEITHVDSYVRIEIARFQEKLKVLYNVDPNCKCRIPPLILQPLVENAIKHGILPKKEGGMIIISGNISGDTVYLIVEDNGVGMDPEFLDNVLKDDVTRKTIGLCNVNSRLKNIYGDKYGLLIESWLGKGTRVTIPIPLEKEGEDDAKGLVG